MSDADEKNLCGWLSSALILQSAPVAPTVATATTQEETGPAKPATPGSRRSRVCPPVCAGKYQSSTG